jgi:large subunit ribosomal protein L2
MAVRKYKPVTATLRFKTAQDFSDVSVKKPNKALLLPIKKAGGRNNQGRLTVRRRGGGHKRHYRIIDFKRDKLDIPAVVQRIEYDPNRSVRIALIKYLDGEYRYILAPLGLKEGAKIISSTKAEIHTGNSLPLENIPLGSSVHNIELKPGKKGQIARAAGTFAVLSAKEKNMALLRLPSTEIRKVPLACRATIGQLGNVEHENVVMGSAGRNRWKGNRPKVRGVAMNPVDHPMGGGEGKASGGGHPTTPWGKKTKGLKTRRKKPGKNLIVQRRKKKKKKG